MRGEGNSPERRAQAGDRWLVQWSAAFGERCLLALREHGLELLPQPD